MLPLRCLNRNWKIVNRLQSQKVILHQFKNWQRLCLQHIDHQMDETRGRRKIKCQRYSIDDLHVSMIIEMKWWYLRNISTEHWISLNITDMVHYLKTRFIYNWSANIILPSVSPITLFEATTEHWAAFPSMTEYNQQHPSVCEVSQHEVILACLI